MDRNLQDASFREREAAHSVFLNHEIEKITASTNSALEANEREIERLRRQVEELQLGKDAAEATLRDLDGSQEDRRRLMQERLDMSQQTRHTLEAQVKDMSELVSDVSAT